MQVVFVHFKVPIRSTAMRLSPNNLSEENQDASRLPCPPMTHFCCLDVDFGRRGTFPDPVCMDAVFAGVDFTGVVFFATAAFTGAASALTKFSSAANRMISPVTFSACASFDVSRSVWWRRNLRSCFALRPSACSSSRSSAVGTGGRSSMGGPNGAIMRVTMKRLLLDVRQPLRISTTSPVRSELLGSWTRCFSGFLKYYGRARRWVSQLLGRLMMFASSAGGRGARRAMWCRGVPSGPSCSTPPHPL